MHQLKRAALLVLLAGCSPGNDELTGSYRMASAPIYSSATLDENRLIGQWKQVGAFGAGDCDAGGVDFAGGPGALTAALHLCLSRAEVSASGPVPRIGPGRYHLPGLDEEVWLLWVDADARTLLFGTPSGAFGFVLNRGGALPADRERALREILDWNGYDAAALALW